MTVSINYSGNIWTTISDKVDFSSNPNTTTRIDDAFESGTLKIYNSRAANITPYTPVIIDGKHYVADGKSTRYRGETSLYVHDINLLEATAILKCFIIGTKMYSAESPTWGNDYKKFYSLLGQAKRLYPDFSFVASNGNNQLTYLQNLIKSKKTYQFGATSTLYDCLNQICIENNKKLSVKFDVNDPSIIQVYLVDVPSNTTYTIDTSRVMNDERDQDRENYGRYLETYASNVVDRDTITYVTWLQPQSSDIALNSDTCKLFLPSNIESIVEFGVHQLGQITITVKGISSIFPDPASEFNATLLYGAAAVKVVSIDGTNYALFEDLYEHYIRDYFPNCTKAEFYSGSYCATVGSYIANGDYVNIYIPYQLNGMYPMDNAVYESNAYNLLTPQQQAKKLVYTIGSNVIDNMNGAYKNDLWNNILHITTYNFLKYHDEDPYVTPLGYPYTSIQTSMGMHASNNTDPMHYNYWVKYHPITNPFLRDTKYNADLLNTYKCFGRSYGNSANFIDFDKIIPSMHTSNDALGTVERVVEIDVTGDNSLPMAGQQVTYDLNIFYISSCIITYKVEAKIATLVLVKDYNKKATSIGVDSQSESTNNPLHNIVTRPIFINTTATSLPSPNQSWYARFTFHNTSNNQIINKDKNNNNVSKLIKRLTMLRTDILNYSRNAVIFYCEMLDQMVFDNGKGNYQGLGSGYYQQIPFRYTDLNAECGYVTIEIGMLASPNPFSANPIIDTDLPIGSTTFSPIYTFTKIKIDKDAREKLTFTIRFDQTDYK